MNTRSFLLTSAILTVASLAACAEPSPSITPTPDHGRVVRDRITSNALEGNLLGDPTTRDFNVYLPPGYDTNAERYPTVYVLHWFTGDEGTFLARVHADADTLRAKGELGNMIFVFPDASSAMGGSYYMSSPTVGDYETYITKELIEQVDSTYRTIPERDSRGIMGCSMGGWGTWHLALSPPRVVWCGSPDGGYIRHFG